MKKRLLGVLACHCALLLLTATPVRSELLYAEVDNRPAIFDSGEPSRILSLEDRYNPDPPYDRLAGVDGIFSFSGEVRLSSGGLDIHWGSPQLFLTALRTEFELNPVTRRARIVTERDDNFDLGFGDYSLPGVIELPDLA